MARPRGSGREDRRAGVAPEGEALGRHVRGGDRQAAHDPRLRGEEAAARGLPLPGHVRLRPEVDVDRARGQPARGVRLDVALAEPLVRAEQEPHAVRRAHDRVDGGGRGAGAERAAAGRRRHLQPAARAHAARDRRDAPLRAARPADAVADAVGPGEPDAVQHAAARRPAADADQQPGDGVARGGGASRRTSTTSTSCASRITGTTTSRRTTRTSSSTRPQYGY